jgi:hypothetical protein
VVIATFRLSPGTVRPTAKTDEASRSSGSAGRPPEGKPTICRRRPPCAPPIQINGLSSRSRPIPRHDRWERRRRIARTSYKEPLEQRVDPAMPIVCRRMGGRMSGPRLVRWLGPGDEADHATSSVIQEKGTARILRLRKRTPEFSSCHKRPNRRPEDITGVLVRPTPPRSVDKGGGIPPPRRTSFRNPCSTRGAERDRRRCCSRRCSTRRGSRRGRRDGEGGGGNSGCRRSG